MKRAVEYLRYSSERQTEQSIEGQKRVCDEFAKANGFVIVNTYIDRAMTGTNDQRPAFRQMLRDSERRQFDYVIVYKGDRFARNRVESAINKKILRDNGVKVVSAAESIPDTPEGIIMESLLEGMAEYYSAELSQKVRRGLNESRLKRQFTGGHSIYGYDIVNKKYVVNETEAEIVRGIFDDYIGGKTVKSIVSELNAKGLTNKFGKPFAVNSVHGMLGREQYVGVIRHGDEVFRDTVPPIISAETWEKVCRIKEANKRSPARRKSFAKYLLSGKLYCGECGGLMTGETGTSKTGSVYNYYKCFEKKRHSKPCRMPSIRKDLIEDQVFSACKDVLMGGFIPSIVDVAYNLRKKETDDNVVLINLRESLAEKEKALKNILKAIESGIFNNTTNDRMKALEEEIQALKFQIDSEIRKQSAVVTKDDYFRFFKSFLDAQIDDSVFREEVVNFLIRKVVLFRDKIRITFNYSPDDGSSGKVRDYPGIDPEVAEAQDEHSRVGKCSNSLPLSPPSGSNPNPNIFVAAKYWGIWISTKKR